MEELKELAKKLKSELKLNSEELVAKLNSVNIPGVDSGFISLMVNEYIKKVTYSDIERLKHTAENLGVKLSYSDVMRLILN